MFATTCGLNKKHSGIKKKKETDQISLYSNLKSPLIRACLLYGRHDCYLLNAMVINVTQMLQMIQIHDYRRT